MCILDEKQNEHIFQATYNAVTFTIVPRNFARSGVSRDCEKFRVQVHRANTNRKLVYGQCFIHSYWWSLWPRNFAEISPMWPHINNLRYQKTDTLYLWQKRQHWIVVYAESDLKNAFYMKTQEFLPNYSWTTSSLSLYLSHTLVRNAFTWSMLL